MSTPHLEPKQLDVPQVLARDWINRHGTFRTVSTGGQRERTGTDWGMVITEAARWGQRQGWFARAAAEPSAVKESLTAPPANTIAECGGPCEQDFRLCDCGLLQKMNPQRAAVATTEARPVGLVERVAEAMQPGTFDWSAYEDEARAAIREVAKWLEQQQEVPIGRSTASADYFAAMLEQETDL